MCPRLLVRDSSRLWRDAFFQEGQMEKWNAGILIFDDVEILDFAGPFEVFSRTRLVPGPESRRSEDSAPFHVFTVAKTAAPIQTTGGLRAVPHYGFVDPPTGDLPVRPRGGGARPRHP